MAQSAYNLAVCEGTRTNQDRWREVSRVFSKAVALEGEARITYLDDACRADPVLRAEVDSMLAAHAEAGSFDDTAVFASSETEKRLAPIMMAWPAGTYNNRGSHSRPGASQICHGVC